MEDSNKGRNGNNERTSDVRLKVSNWLSGIVEEVVRKNPLTIQKWVDNHSNIRFDSSVNQNTSTTTTNFENSVNNCEGLNHKKVNNVTLGGVESKFWTKEGILHKFNRTSNKTIGQDEISSVSNIKNIKSIKLNEFYDSFCLNKTNYELIKVKKMSKEKGDEIKDDNIEIEGEHVIDLSTKNVSQKDFFTDPLQGTFDAHNDSFLGSRPKLKLREIGRCSTIETHSGNPKVSSPKNINLSNIGRSYSEQNDDDDDEDDNFLLNERSRSYSHVINERINNKNLDKVSCSLPTFFGHKSMSVSPIPHVKGTMSRETSLSESPRRNLLLRDSSFQSDSSHCSSVESLLESRKPDPEAILINLGFGPIESEDVLSKIPKRFLKPSQVRGVDTEEFLKRQQLANHLHDHSVLGYRGLVGNPDIPPSMIVAKIMERFEINERNRSVMDINMNRPQSAPPTPGPNQ